MDSRSLAMTAQGMTNSPLLLLVQGQPLVTPPRERQVDDVDAKACPERSDAIALGTDASTPPRRTIVVAADDVNLTPSPQTTLADRCLKHFTERVTKAR